jgi:hypothetical protein
MTPPLSPLERLQVTDGLLLTADRWQLAHAYHRQRQNLHYQSLNQAGIVCGLGVRVIPAPTYIASQYRDQRWVQIQPGMAIDGLGNPIVVPQPVDYRIAATPGHDPITVYLVASYVDPERLETVEQREVVQETFRIDEKTTPPGDSEVELCRIQLAPGTIHLGTPPRVFAPQANQLDLRYRQWVGAKPITQVRVGHWCPPGTSQKMILEDSFQTLFTSLPGLYPRLQGQTSRPAIATLTPDALIDLDLLYTAYTPFTELDSEAQEVLGQFLQTGGVVMIEVPTEITALNDLVQVQYDLSEAVSSLQNSQQRIALKQELTTELTQIQATMDSELTTLVAPIRQFADRVGLSITGPGQVDRQHPLRSHPFQFLRWPQLHRQPLEILNWGGIVMTIGQLTRHWGADTSLPLSRETLRSHQELGINLLHFAWLRRHYHTCLGSQTPPDTDRENLLNPLA